jgi:hypothetical protein
MADLTVNIDSNLALSDIESRCKFEQDAGFQLQNIQNGAINAEGQALTVNIAEFMSKPIGRLKNLSFVAVGTSNAAELKAQKVAAGWTSICDSKIYVTNQITSVLVFGK